MESGKNINESSEVGTPENPSATGENPYLPGFAEKTLNAHWEGGKSDHSKEYPGFTKEQYAHRAQELVRSATSDTVLGYKMPNGTIVRYDTKTSDFVKSGNVGIRTMFKPSRGLEYFNDRLADDGGMQND